MNLKVNGLKSINLNPQLKLSDDGSHLINKPDPQVEKPTQVEIENGAQDEASLTYDHNDHHDHKIHAERVLEQDSAIALESRAVEGLEKGYTRIPNVILMQLIAGHFTRNEIKVALVIARFTISFRREFSPLSKKVLERQTGLRGASILEAVAGLIHKGIIYKIQGDHFRPNMLGFHLPKNWDEPEKPTNKKDSLPIKSQPPTTPKKTGPEVEIKPQAQVENSTQGEFQKKTSFKDIKIYKNNNSLSVLPQNLQDYFDSLKPHRKRESEWRAFKELSRDYSVSDIADCFLLLGTRGVRVGRSNEFQLCHSPMAYLSKAMNEVLKEVLHSRKLQSLKQEQTNQDMQLKTEEKEVQNQEMKLWREKEEAFKKAHPSQDLQQAKIVELCRNKFKPTQLVGRIFAITQWWQMREEQPQWATC